MKISIRNRNLPYTVSHDEKTSGIMCSKSTVGFTAVCAGQYIGFVHVSCQCAIQHEASQLSTMALTFVFSCKHQFISLCFYFSLDTLFGENNPRNYQRLNSHLGLTVIKPFHSTGS